MAKQAIKPNSNSKTTKATPSKPAVKKPSVKPAAKQPSVKPAAKKPSIKPVAAKPSSTPVTKSVSKSKQIASKKKLTVEEERALEEVEQEEAAVEEEETIESEEEQEIEIVEPAKTPTPSKKTAEFLRRQREGLPTYDQPSVRTVGNSQTAPAVRPVAVGSNLSSNVLFEKLNQQTAMLERIQHHVKNPTTSTEWKKYVYPELTRLLRDNRYPDDIEVKVWILENCLEDISDDYSMSFDKWWRLVRKMVGKYIRDKRSSWSENIRTALSARAPQWEEWTLEEKSNYIKTTFEQDVEARLELAAFTRQIMNLGTDDKPTKTDKAFVLVTMERFAAGKQMGDSRKRKRSQTFTAVEEPDEEEEWDSEGIRNMLWK